MILKLREKEKEGKEKGREIKKEEEDGKEIRINAGNYICNNMSFFVVVVV